MPGLLIVFLIPLVFINVRDSHDWGGDFAQYLAQAKNISSGISPCETKYVYNEEYPIVGPETYPPGFSLLIAPVYLIFGDHMKAFMIFITVFLIAFSVAVFYFYKLFLNSFNSILLILLLAYSPFMLGFKSEVVSDIPFAFFFIILVLFYFKQQNFTIAYAILIGILSAFLVEVRTIGYVFIMAVLLWFFISLLNSGKKAHVKIAQFVKYHIILLVVFSGSFIILSLLIFPCPANDSSSYANMFVLSGLFQELLMNIDFYLKMILQFFQPSIGLWQFLTTILSSFVLVFFIIGLVKKLGTQISFIEVLFLLYISVLLVYPYRHGGFRFLLPVAPFVLYYAVYGINRSGFNKVYKKFTLVNLILILILISFINPAIRIIKNQGNIVDGPQKPESVEVFKFIRDEMPENTVIGFFKPRVLAYYTERYSVSLENIDNVEQLFIALKKFNVLYILFHRKFGRLAEEFVHIDSINPEVLFVNSDFELIKIKTNLPD